MAVSREQVLEALRTLTLPNGEDLVSRDLVRALTIDENTVRFVIEAESPEVARQMEGVRRAAEQIVSRGEQRNGPRLDRRRLQIGFGLQRAP